MHFAVIATLLTDIYGSLGTPIGTQRTCARLNVFVVFEGHFLNQFVVFWLILSKWVCRFLGGIEASAALVRALSGLGSAPISATFTHDNSI